jgi:death on curing protein
VATEYLTVADVLALHAELIDRYGGAGGLRDPGALESALFRPQSGYYDDIVQEAAALMESLAMSHPFVDGNKRIAFAAVDVFLRINGYRIQGRPMAIHRLMMNLFETGKFELHALEAMLRKLIVKQG